MKFVMVVAVLFGPVDGEWTEFQKTVFTDEFPNAQACYAAADALEKEQSAKENFRGIVIDCSPANDVSLRNAVL